MTAEEALKSAEEALKLRMQSMPEIEKKEYEKIMNMIEFSARQGEFKITIDRTSENVLKMLQSDGYKITPIYSMYYISWGNEEVVQEKMPKKKKWLFG